ncbi:MAG TPA: glycosyltransferase [Candidatus Baltobacteraceae bacterium]|jgi:glycosyltransferase involved in cell wall biosynthesis|nr:glycosyltransferase [Candidatus Baltobacteraceae bacterium]
MKRLLLVSYVFPPAPSPGALRPGYLARYLPQFGWDVTTLTTGDENPTFPARLLRATPQLEQNIRGGIVGRSSSPHSPLRRLMRAAKETIYFPDSTAGWMPPAISAGLNALASEPYDAIMSTALPASAHVIAWILAKKTGLPWIADYRDPWNGNAYLRRGPVRRMLERWLERGMLHRANAVTTISEAIASQLAAFHKRRDVHVIPNAYDPSDWEGVPEISPARFDLCFTGSMYGGTRNPDLLFAALAQLRSAGEPAGNAARVHFYGPNSEQVIERASHYGLTLIVRHHGTVPRAAAMRAQRSCAGLLIFLNMDPATGSEMGSKYLEYLGAHRPILAFGPPNSVMRDFLSRTGVGWFAGEVDQAAQAVRDAYDRFTSGAFEVRAEPGSVSTSYELARRFTEILDGVSAPGSFRSIA